MRIYLKDSKLLDFLRSVLFLERYNIKRR